MNTYNKIKCFFGFSKDNKGTKELSKEVLYGTYGILPEIKSLEGYSGKTIGSI